jgi:CPA2 family monovalent cation:H+ antiporter-2
MDLIDIIIIILSGLFLGYISHLLRLPLILGYIISGIFIGPHTGGITLSNVDEISVLSEIGVALLLFSIGMDLSMKEIKEVMAKLATKNMIQDTKHTDDTVNLLLYVPKLD